VIIVTILKKKIVVGDHKNNVTVRNDNKDNVINNANNDNDDIDNDKIEENHNNEQNNKNSRARNSNSLEEENKEPPRKKPKKILNNENKNEEMTFGMKLAMIEKENEENMKLEMKNEIPTADSLALLLTQSLSSNDQKMFEDLININEEYNDLSIEDELIRNTLDRISSETALLLLQKLNEKFRSRHRESIDILRWLIPLLNRHAGFFSSNINSRQHLVSVYQGIDYHLKSMMPALKLQGRLSLLMNQINKVNHLTNINNNKKIPNFISNTKVINGIEMAKHQTLFRHFDNDQNKNNVEDN